MTTITKDTTRGTTTKKVKQGTPVTVIATRQDPDGLKLLVALGKGTGRRFQVRADETNYQDTAA